MQNKFYIYTVTWLFLREQKLKKKDNNKHNLNFNLVVSLNL